ncbi:hypothetical protein [Pseudonocardia acaciae]|uniref:hypothetical protein n=1 Tax=Pseudonocardia acaciae TaxID=551276 RepID=UPI0006855F2F|nr:hypothetical protein [Pseudonocardia acaciae]
MADVLVTAQPVAPDAERRAGRRVVVFLADPVPPEWVLDWCRDHGGRPSLRQTSTRPPHGAPSGLPRAVAELAGHEILLPRPSPDHPPRPAGVTVAIGDLPKDAEVLAAAADAAAHLGTGLVLAHGVPPSFAERSVGLGAALSRGRWLLDTAARRVAAQVPGLAVARRLERAWPHELVSQGSGVFDPAGLLVLGMPVAARDGGVGLVASSALHFWPNAILFVPTSPA